MASKNKNQQRSFPISERIVFSGTLLGFCLFLLLSGWTQRIDYIFYDTFLKWQPSTTTSASVIVGIDEKSLNKLGRWPWDRAIHAELISKIKAAGAEAIIFDILLTESGSADSDAKLQQQMQLAGNVFLPMHMDHRSGSGLMTEILPTPEFTSSAAGIGHAHFELDQDGIARGLYLYQGLGDSYWPSLALTTYSHVVTAVSNRSSSLMSSVSTARNSPISNSKSPSEPLENLSGSHLLNIREAYRLIPFSGPSGSFATLSYSDVLQSELPSDYFSGRVVFVGATAAGLGDFIATPMSGDLINMPGAEIHANVYEALTNQSLGKLISLSWQYGITLSTVIVISLIFPKISPTKNLPLVVFCCLLVSGLSYALLMISHLWFAPSALLLTLLFAYPFWSWRRLYRLSRFLNHELERLAIEPKLNMVSSTRSPQQWSQHLVKLLNPDFWEFRSVNPHRTPEFTINEQNQTAEINLPFHDQSEMSALYMQFSAPLKDLTSIIRYVKQLFPEFDGSSAKVSSPGELMDRRVVQVRRAIAAMRDMRQFISDTVNHMPDGVMVGDEFGRILFMNNPARQWLQKGAKAGAFLAEFMPVTSRVSTEQWKKTLREILFEEKARTEELHSENKAVLTTLAPINFTNSSRGIVITFADISVIHEAQMKRMETIHFISHDLKAPLASQLALLDNLRISLPNEFAPKLLSAQKLTEKSLTMSDQFLQLARIESADHVHLYSCELLDVIDNAVDATTPLATEASVIIKSVCDQESVTITGNPELLERSLINLIQNAIKFSPPNSFVDIVTSLDELGAKIVVEDHGQGIDARELPFLFDAYRRTRASEQQGIAGSGLGLRFVKLVMDRHGGEVHVSSQLKKGTCFTLILPVKVASNDSHQQAARITQ